MRFTLLGYMFDLNIIKQVPGNPLSEGKYRQCGNGDDKQTRLYQRNGVIIYQYENGEHTNTTFIDKDSLNKYSKDYISFNTYFK